MILFLKIFFKELFISLFAKISGYYNSIDDISAYNWHFVEQGELQYLYKRIKIKKTPAIFKEVVKEMFYQFEKIDPTYFRKLHKLAYLKSLYLTTQNIRYLNDANTLEYNILHDEPKKKAKHTLNEKINFIETVFNSIGQINPKKLSASRFYSMLDLAIQKANKNANS